MRFQVEGAHEGVGHRPASLVLFRMEHRVNSQACLGGGAANNCEEELPRTQRRAGAVAADEAEQTMLDRVPFGQGVMMPVSRSASSVVNGYE